MNTPSENQSSKKMTPAEFTAEATSNGFETAYSKLSSQVEHSEAERMQFIRSISNDAVRQKLARLTYGVAIAANLGLIEPEVDQEDHKEFVGFTQINAKLW